MRCRLGACGPGVGLLLAIGMGSMPPARGVASPPDRPAPAGAAPASPPAAPKLALVKPAPAGGSTFPWFPDYLRVLERFPLYHSQHWHEIGSQQPALGYFGTGDEAGALTGARALLAIAYLAAEPGYDPRPSGISAAALRARAVASLRYLLRTHTTGDLDSAGGGRWGGDLAAARAVGLLIESAHLLKGQLESSDDRAVARVAAAEADSLLKQTPASGAPRASRASENAAAADALAWAAALLPRHPHAPLWDAQARRFAMNTLSAPQDRGGEASIDGRAEREWVTTENLLPDYLLESGGALNPDFELATLASLSDAYYAYSSEARSVPAALTHHYEDAWNALRRLWLGGHRLARPAGTGVPAGEEEDHSLFPACALLEWVGSEPSVARLIERNSFQALEAGQISRGDGSFRGGIEGSEAATAASLALAALIHRRQTGIVAPASPVLLREQLAGAGTSPAAAFAAARSADCFASWSWRSVGNTRAPMGLFVPLDDEALAAWQPDQLTGSFALQGFTGARTLLHRERTVEGGFTATGEIDEGIQSGRSGLRHFVAFAALPARRIAVLFDLAVAARALTVTRSEGLCLGIAPAAPGESAHTLQAEEGAVPLPGDDPAAPAAVSTVASSWLSLDNRLGIAALYSQEPFTLRRVAPAGSQNEGAPAVVIDTPYATQPVAFQAGQIVRDTVILLVAGDGPATVRLARASTVLPTSSELARAVVVTGVDSGRYLVAANFGLNETLVSLSPPGAASISDLRLAPLDTLVRALESQ